MSNPVRIRIGGSGVPPKLQAPELLLATLVIASIVGAAIAVIRRLAARRRRRRHLTGVIERSRRGRPLRPPRHFRLR